jgi:tRNA (guanine-N7-)-methyltransferase
MVLALLPARSVEEIRMFFPDPWPKRKHRERRLFQSAFLDRVIEVLAPGGVFWLATDNADYADQVRTAGAERAELVAVTDPPAAGYARPSTKYARRAAELGHDCADLIWRRSAR